MKCPNCQKEIEDDSNQCIYCNTILFKDIKIVDNIKKMLNKFKNSKELSEYNYLNNVYKIGKFITVLLAMFTIVFISEFVFSGSVYINGTLGKINTIFKYCIEIGIFLIILSLIMFIKNRYRKFAVFLFILSIVMINLNIVREFVFSKTNEKISLNDYSKVEYIELGDEKIPSLYSVVGYRKIVLSNEDKNYYDSTIDRNLDTVSIIYYSLSSSDIYEYKKFLIDYGFENKNFINDDKSINMYVKNDIINDEFYAINIDGPVISYYKLHGKYEDLFKEEEKNV